MKNTREPPSIQHDIFYQCRLVTKTSGDQKPHKKNGEYSKKPKE